MVVQVELELFVFRLVILTLLLVQSSFVLELAAVCPGILRKEFGEILPNHTFVGPLLNSLQAPDEITCQYFCHADPTDRCFMYNYQSPGSLRQLLDGNNPNEIKIERKTGWTARAQKCSTNSCLNGGRCYWFNDQDNTSCLCTGPRCANQPQVIEWKQAKEILVCIRTKENEFGKLVMPLNGIVQAFKLVYVSGPGVSFRESRFGRWGGTYDNDHDLQMHVTDTSNNRIAPPISFPLREDHQLSYRIPGVTNMDDVLVFPDCSPRVSVTEGQLFRVWFGPDLTNVRESTNEGETCANAYVGYN